MLGCFVGSAETAARGVPERFVGKAISGVTVKQEEVKEDTKSTPKTQPTTQSDKTKTEKSNADASASGKGKGNAGQGSSAAEPMAVDA